MKIDSYSMGMDSSRQYSSVTNRATKFTLTRMNLNQMVQNGLGESVQSEAESKENTEGTGEAFDKTNLEELRDRYKTSAAQIQRVSTRDAADSLQKIRQQCIRYIFDLLFSGRRSRSNSMSDSSNSANQNSQTFVESLQPAEISTTTWTQEIYFQEEENTTFSTQGTVKTADGREINFNLDLEMSRSFSAYYKEEMQISQLQVCDPLVINLDGNVAGLSDQKFMFDLDGDGADDEISMLQEGSGYLALDKNGDGQINDGNELFGTQSGDGFADLAIYDEDGNGWIDENDAIWDKLQIWVKDESGEDTLYKLSEKGVGAICLRKAETQHNLNSQEDNSVNGIIRNTGIFLYENGNVGTVQHLDLAR